MRQTLTAVLAALMLAAPVAQAQEEAPQEGPSLIEQGARMFLKGLMQEASPALEGMREMAERLGPQLREFAEVMGPALADILAEVEDLSDYEAPEMLPNGDIIIRRKPQDEDEDEDDDETPALPEAPKDGEEIEI